MNLSKNAQVRKALNHAEGSADRNGAGFDCANFEGVLAIVHFGDIATSAVTSIKAQQSADNSSYADLAGTKIAVADDDDNQVFVLDIYRPADRYVRVVVDKDAANNTEETAVYIGYGARKHPVAGNVTNEVTLETHVSPAEGTA